MQVGSRYREASASRFLGLSERAGTPCNACSRSYAIAINCASRKAVLYINIPAGLPDERMPTGIEKFG